MLSVLQCRTECVCLRRTYQYMDNVSNELLSRVG